ncbi:MAG: TetR/AcrR family transcriptional regulator [Aeromicrobium sp.]
MTVGDSTVLRTQVVRKSLNRPTMVRTRFRTTLITPRSIMDAGTQPEVEPLRQGRPGRRRDPGIDQAALAAALRVYQADGWQGFTFESVAKEAGVGKPALYRRWPTPANLLIDAFEQLHLPAARDCGSLRDDLIDYGMQFVHWFQTAGAVEIGRRLAVDRLRDDSLHKLYEQYVRRARLDAAREMTDRAIARGELKSADDGLLIIEMLIGAMNMRWDFTPPTRLAKLEATFPAYVERIVEVVLDGLLSSGPAMVAALPADHSAR